MTRKSRELSSEEKRLWRRVAENVKPRRASPRDESEAPAEPELAAHQAVTLSAPKAKTTISRHKPPPADRGAERRVKRGQVEIEARLDLHGLAYEAAQHTVQAFVQRAYRNGARCLLVITGYGRGGEGVLKKNLPAWLERAPLREIVSGFAQAHRAHGGAGAYYVFLKRKPDTR